MPDLDRVKAGEAVRASHINALRDALADIAAGRLPAELEQRMLTSILTALDPERFIVCKIVDVKFNTDGPYPPLPPAEPGGPTTPDPRNAPVMGVGGRLTYWPSQIEWYEYRGFGKPGVHGYKPPVYGRPVEGDECRIYPAQVHMTCLVEIDVDAEGERKGRLMLLPGSERVARRRCGTGG